METIRLSAVIHLYPLNLAIVLRKLSFLQPYRVVKRVSSARKIIHLHSEFVIIRIISVWEVS